MELYGKSVLRPYLKGGSALACMGQQWEGQAGHLWRYVE